MSSKTRRKGIEYTPQFGGGIFRPVEEVEQERDALDDRAAPEEATEEPGVIVAESPRAPAETQPAPQPERASNEASARASTLASYPAALVATIRKVVRTPGREVSFVRLSPEEKGQLADIVYTFKRQGVKTSENEINRIAINFLLEDYHQHGEGSLLVRVLAALQA